MNKHSSSKSKTPLQFKIFHTLIGFAVFFSLITVPAESQVIDICGIQTASELLWWPIVFFLFQLIYRIYGFEYLRHSVYLVIIFHAIYVLFLQFAIWLPASSFWQMQHVYTDVLGRDVSYLIKISVLLWCTVLLPINYLSTSKNRNTSHIFLVSLLIFSIINLLTISTRTLGSIAEISIPFAIYLGLNIVTPYLMGVIETVEKADYSDGTNKNLFEFKLPNISNSKNANVFKYHHILFCLSIVFFIASKTMAAKFISLGFMTINVGGIVFSLAYLVADIMTDVYGIERTKQMVRFVIFCNLLFVFDVWLTNALATGENDPFKLILHNQARMFIASATAFFLGMTINSTVISLLKSRQRRRGISLKREFITTVWIRLATSSAFGIIIDVSLFSLVAFYGIVPTEKLAGVVINEDAYKIGYEILLAPISILLIYFLKVKERVDIYDELSNLNPFRINTDYNLRANKFNENFVQPKRQNDEKSHK